MVLTEVICELIPVVACALLVSCTQFCRISILFYFTASDMKNETARFGCSMLTPNSIKTRQCILDCFPLGVILSRSYENPLTVHDVGHEIDTETVIFRVVWSLIAESLVVPSQLSRSAKEEIATAISRANECPVCITAHDLFGGFADHVKTDACVQNSKTAKTEVEEGHIVSQAIAYAHRLHEATLRNSSSPIPVVALKEDSFDLSPTVRTEVALLVLLFEHLNRVVNALVGPALSHSMYSVPSPLAKAIESKTIMSVARHFLNQSFAGPLRQKPSPGFTNPLFDVEELKQTTSLPSNLQGIHALGDEPTRAMARWVALVDVEEDPFKTKILAKLKIDSYLPNFLIEFCEQIFPPGGIMVEQEMIEWATGPLVRQLFNSLVESHDESLELKETWYFISVVLLLTKMWSKTVYKSDHWNSLTTRVGNFQARTILVWFSMRLAVRQAQGLR